jgi:hypothetical protein
VTVLGSLEVDGLGKVEFLDNHTGTHVKVLADDLDKLFRGLVAGAVALDEEGQRLSDTNGVRELDKAASGKLGGDERLCNPAGEVCGRAIDFAVVLAGECTTTVSTPAAVCVDDDLASGETGVTLRTTNDEKT